MTLLKVFIEQWQRDAWNAVKPDPEPLTPGQALGAAGAKAADLGLLRIPEAWKPFVTVRRYHVEDCGYCAQYTPGEMFPPHEASPRCESGKRNHCTCDVCF